MNLNRNVFKETDWPSVWKSLTKYEDHIGEYWPEVMTVRTEHPEVCIPAKASIPQYCSSKIS